MDSILTHFRDLGVYLNSDWLAGLELVHDEPLTDDDVYSALMHSDLRESCTNPARSIRNASKFPAGSFLFQITSSADISLPDAQRPRTSGTSTQRMLKMILHSGPGTEIAAVELENLCDLQDNPDAGLKVIILAEPLIVDGIVFLKRENFKVVGGNVSHLVHAQANDRDRRIRARDPLTYRAPLAEIQSV